MNKDVNLNKTSKNSAAYRKGLYTNTNWENLKNVTWFSISKLVLEKDLIYHLVQLAYKQTEVTLAKIIQQINGED